MFKNDYDNKRDAFPTAIGYYNFSKERSRSIVMLGVRVKLENSIFSGPFIDRVNRVPTVRNYRSNK